MEQQSYKIDVLHFLNPHVIWVEVLQTSTQSNEKFAFEQIGVYGVLPLENESHICDESIRCAVSTEWNLRVNKILEQVFAGAVELQFKPIFMDRNSIFESKIHKYGDITIKCTDGKIKSLARILKKSNFVKYDKNRFKSELLSGNLQIKSNSVETENVLKILKKSWHVKHKSQILKDCPSSTCLSEVECNKTNQYKYELTEKNLELHNMQIEQLNVPKKALYCSNDFKEVSVSMAFSKPNYLEKIGRGVEKQTESWEKYRSSKEDEKCEIGPIYKRRQDTKKKLFEIVDQHAVTHTKNELQVIMSEDKLKSEDIQLQSQFIKNGPIKTTYVENKIIQKKIKEIDVKATATSLGPDLEYERKKTIPEYDEKTKKRIAFGPPDCLEKLNIQIVPKYSENHNTFNTPTSTIERNLKRQNKEQQDHKTDKDYNQIKYEHSDDGSLNRFKLNYIFKQAINKHNLEEELTHQMHSVAKMNKDVEVTERINMAQSLPKQFINSSVESNDLDISLNSNSSQMISRKLKFLGLESSQKSNFLNDAASKCVSFSSTEDKDLQINKTNNRDLDNETTLSSIVEEIVQSKEYLSLLQRLQKFVEKGKKLSVNDIVIANYLKENNINPLKNVDPSLSKFVDKLISPNLMVHTKKNNRIIPNLEMRDVNFVPNIHAVLRNLCIKHPMMLQTVSWYTILRGFSLFMISPSRSGKTLGYLPAISNLIIHHYQETDRFGPVCIVVCATAKAVADAANLCKRFLGNSKLVLSYYSGINEERFLAQLLNGCDILFSTLPALVRLMNVGVMSLNLQRLSIVVMDDCETLSQTHEKEIKFLIYKVKDLLQTRVNNIEKVQIIVASRIWCDFMEPFAKWAPDTVVCIGSHLECVLYSKVHTSIDFMQKDKKIEIVIEFMKSVDITKKTVIVCQTDEEVTLIENRLKQEKLIVYRADNKMTVEMLYNLSEDWREYSDPVLGPVLICCDENLVHLNITDAHNLLHYSLPNLYSTFAKRFSVLADSYPSIFTDNKSNSNVIKILLDKENIEQLSKILHFVKRSSKEIPQRLDQIADNAMIEKDFVKAQRLVPLCEYLLSLSQCPNFWYCKARHTVFKEYDEPPQWVPRHGFITFQVINVHNAVMYSARLLSQIINGEVNKYSQNYSTIAMKMAMYYSNENNRRPHGIPKIGDLCAVAVKINLYQRCQIVNVLAFNDKGNPELLLIKLIDDEKWEKAKVTHLYYLSEELKSVPSHVVQVRLGNIQPKDKDVTYSYIADDLIKKILESDENFYMKAEIVLAIGTTLIVDKLEVCQDLIFANQSIVRYNIKEELLKVHAMINDEHVAKLQKIVEKAGLSVCNKDSIVQNINPIPAIKEILKPSWAHLSKDDFSLVYFASANDLSQIFIRLIKFQNCLYLLTKDIQRYIANIKFEKVATFEIGEFVLAKFPDDGLYYRARIQEAINEMKYRCFFVDHGDWRQISSSCIFPITEEFIMRMPFQAIECRLIGIRPMGEEWTEFSINWFYDQCFMDKSDRLKTLYVKYFIKEVPEFTDGHKYGIVMVDTTGPQDIIINQGILDANLAQPVDNEINYINKVNFKRPLKASSNSDESDWEKDSVLYEDNHYERKFDVSESNTKSFLNDIFPKIPMRSVPLVASDDDSSLVDDFDFDMTQEEIKTLFSQASKVSSNQQLIPIMNSSKRGTTPESFVILGTQTEDRVSTRSSSSPEIIRAHAEEIIDPSKLYTVIHQLPSNPKFAQRDETPGRVVKVEENQTNPSSTLSGFEVVSPAIKSELDSDDYSNSENISISMEEYAKETKLRPKLCWNQTRSIISIKIEIIGVENYEIGIKERSIKFSAILNDIQYAFDIELYGIIKPNMSKHDAKGLYVLVKLYKRMPKTWLTLTRDDQMKRWIVYDPDSIDTSSDDDDSSTSNKEQFQKCIENTHYAESDRDSDEASFDDTPEKYKHDSD